MAMSKCSPFPDELESFDDIPMDSMLSLNDHCLSKIFKMLDIETLCRMSGVCRRFRAIAEDVFRLYLSDITFKYCYEKNLYRRMLCKFGHLITSIDDETKFDVDVISKYCQPNLKHLKINYATINCDLMQPTFRQLKSLDLEHCQLIGDVNRLFGNYLQLEKIKLFNSDFGAIFPKLQEFSMQISFDSTKFDMFCEFLKLHSQLKKLHIGFDSEDKWISEIVQNTPNLEQLEIYFDFPNSESDVQTKDGLFELVKLRKLKHLKLDFGDSSYGQFACLLMESFAFAKVPIEETILCHFEVTSSDIPVICKFKSISELVLYGQLFENDLISLATKLPKLTHIFIYNELSLTASGLIKLVTVGKRLESIGLCDVKDLHIDEFVFKALVSAVQDGDSKNGLVISFDGSLMETNFDVSQTLTGSNLEILRILM